jgi:fused signal recognition particle receptor
LVVWQSTFLQALACGTILTKADADAKGGAAISIAHITGKPILFLGVGQEYKDLKKFETQWFIDRLFER